MLVSLLCSIVLTEQGKAVAPTPRVQKRSIMLVTRDAGNIDAYKLDSSLVMEKEYLRNHDLVTLESPMGLIVVDRTLVEVPETAISKLIAKLSSSRGTFGENLQEMSTTDRATVKRMIEMSGFSQKFAKFTEGSNLPVWLTPRMAFDVKVNGKTEGFVVWPPPPEGAASPDRLITPKASEIQKKKNDPGLITCDLRALQIIDESGNEGLSLMLSKSLTEFLLQRREESKKRLTAAVGSLSEKWLKNILGFNDDFVTKPKNFSDCSPELQTLMEQSFLKRASEFGFGSVESAKRYLRSQTIDGFRFSSLVTTQVKDDAGIINRTSWGIEVSR